MEYIIRIPKESRNVVPLELVVHEIARGFATRWGEQPFHRATFKEVEQRYSAKIVEAVKRGDLHVCDMDGFIIQNITDELVHRESISEDAIAVAQKEHPECEIAPGMWNFSGIDFDHARECEVTPVGLFITLDDLNKWAKHTGDSFRIEEMPVEVTDVDGMRYVVSTANNEKSVAAGSRDDAVKVGAGAAAASSLPVGIPTRTIIEKFKLTAAWADKLRHIGRNPFLRNAMIQKGCRKSSKTPATPHLWNPVVFAEILIERDGRNRRAMEAIITHQFSDWQDVWYESLASDEPDDYGA